MLQVPGSLDFKVTEPDFAARGTVVEASLVTGRTIRRPCVFAVVTMSTPEEAQKAIDPLNRVWRPSRPFALF